MKNELIGKGFQELSVDEAENISGGSIFSSVLGIISGAFSSITGITGATQVNQKAQGILDIIAKIASPIYSLFGLRF
ncbi:MAG: hypothetical protein LBS84_00395 [Clostridiales bacterium]|jgi:hypothetical protein|nr:hypothetical protein [Clostridiales bacterium]